MEYLLVIIFLSKIFYGYPNPHILTLKHLNDGFGHQDPEFINIGGVWLWLWGLIAVQSDQNQSKITQNKPFLLQYRPDMVMIWPPMASIPLYQSHTTSTSHIQCHMGSMLAEMGSKLAKISQKSIKISHFYTFCALSFQYQATHRPNIWPQLDFTKSPRGFRCYLNHWLTFGSDITAPSTNLAGREMDPERSSALSQSQIFRNFNFMLDLVSDIEFDGLDDLIPKLSSTLL